MCFLGDKRLDKRYEALIRRMQERQSAIVSRLASEWPEQMSYYRFLGNERITEPQLVGILRQKCKDQIGQRPHVLCISDSSMFDYSRRRERISMASGLGYIGDNNGWGYNAHLSLVIDPGSSEVLGLSDVQLWHRTLKRVPRKNLYRKTLEEQESYRWVSCCEKSKPALKSIPCVTFVQDREGDMYDTFARIPAPGFHLLVRSQYNRIITTAAGKRDKLRPHLAAQPVCTSYELDIPPESHKRAARKAVLDVRYAAVEIHRGDRRAYQTKYPPRLPVRVIHACERPDTVPPGEERIEWFLLTTHEIRDGTDAVTLIYWYTCRWLIEELFRVLKTQGFQLESAELETGYSLRRLGLIAMDAAIRVMQLRLAREGNEELPLDAVFTPEEQQCLERIGPQLEGRTGKQKNPHKPKTLAWASWIIARLGGWKGYASQAPPGVITFKRGLDLFNGICLGFHLRL